MALSAHHMQQAAHPSALRLEPWARQWAAGALGLVGLALLLHRLPLLAAAALALGGVFALATLARPWLALLVLPWVVPFGSLVEFPLGIMTVGATELAILWAVAVWMLSFCLHRDRRLLWPSLTLPFWLFAGATLLSLTQSLSLQHSLKELLRWAELFLAMLLVRNTLGQGPRPKWLPQALVGSLLAAGALSAIQGIVQFLGRIGPPGFLLFGRFMRAYGTFQQPNPYGGYLGLTLPLAFALLLAIRARPFRAPLGRLAALPAAALVGSALLMTWSRGAWVGAAGLSAVAILRNRRAALAFGGVAVVVALLVVLGAAGVMPPAITQRFAGLGDYFGIRDVRGIPPTDANWAVLERLAHWQAAWAMVSDHPWLGVGPGNYVAVYPAYALPFWRDPLGHAHNIYLNVAAEMGLVGLGAYLLFWIWAFVALWRGLRRAAGLRQAILLGAIGALVHLHVHNFFDNLYVHGMPIQLGVLLGLALWAGCSTSEAGPQGSCSLTGQGDS
ncbi:MAG: O-antigen ligase family protein [Chloroflexi bacterium]|nr:O-antigen ligase family protein [Chloroflexota bacterium]